MNTVQCPACLCEQSPILFRKRGYAYHQCAHCKTVFLPQGLDQQNKIGGRHEFERNSVQNGVRIERLANLFGGRKGSVLDFGCGHGLFVSTLITMGWDAMGYDAFNPEFDKAPKRLFELATMIEVVEHLSSPFKELSLVLSLLKSNGVLMMESSFVDLCDDLQAWDYIEPSVGHCTIFSHSGLNTLMMRIGFEVGVHINGNVRIFRKP